MLIQINYVTINLKKYMQKLKKLNDYSITTALAVFFVSAWFVLAGPTAVLAATSPTLAAAGTYSVLAGSVVTNTGPTTISGDLGISPSIGSPPHYIAFPPGIVGPPGTIHDADVSAAAAQADNTATFGTIDQGCDTTYAGIQDLTLVSPLGPGVYCADSFILTGNLTLSGSGVWIFKSASTIITSPGSSVTGGNPCNVWWRAVSSVTLNTTTSFTGNVLALTDITMKTGASLNGRVMVQTGQITLDSNTILGPTCGYSPLATLTVIKTVIGSSKAVSDFSLFIDDDSVTSGVSSSTSPGLHTVSETSDSNYTGIIGGDCAADGTITLVSGTAKTCTITNTYFPVPVTPPAAVSGGGSSITVPLIGMVKVPSPLALPGGPGNVIYNYTVWNVGGQQALIDVSVTDNKCGPVVLLSGDTNSNNKLDPGEKWNYSCTAMLLQTTTNTAVATGYSNDGYRQVAIATANATVVVSAPLPPPLINIVKVPSRLTPFSFGGGNVTYIYTVANPGVAVIHNVTVTDDKCATVFGPFGDSSNDKLLNPGEVWTYACESNVAVSTKNTATAEGEANGFTATAQAFATVLVSAPGLPKAGLVPISNNVLLSSPITVLEQQNPVNNESVQSAPADISPKQTNQGIPVRLKIPAINVDINLESVGLTPQGDMDISKGPTNAAWFNLGPRPGETGSAVIDGHYGWWKNGVPAVFENLNKLRTGDKIYIEDQTGATTAFVMRDAKKYNPDADASDVFSSNDGQSHLNLITCNGVWNSIQKSYSDRLVIFTDKEVE